MGLGPEKTPLAFGAYPDKGTDPAIIIHIIHSTGYQHSVTTNLWRRGGSTFFNQSLETTSYHLNISQHQSIAMLVLPGLKQVKTNL